MPARLEEFEDVFNKLAEDVVQECALPCRTLEWFQKVCHNVRARKSQPCVDTGSHFTITQLVANAIAACPWSTLYQSYLIAL